MIELMMVIVIIAILGAAAIPQFLDFRNEAKAAAVRQMLATMRVGIKNQMQQARLKCGSGGDPNYMSGPTTTYSNRLSNTVLYNDITTNSADPTFKVCNSAELPNPSDRYFWSRLSDSERANYTVGGTSFPGQAGNVFKNPF